MAEEEIEVQLRAAIKAHLDKMDHECGIWPNLCEQVRTPQGREVAEGVLFNMCATDGVAVQTAMSTYDSLLGE